MEQIPVIGFSSARYDLNLLQKYLPKHLELTNQTSEYFIVKRNNSYMCISSEWFRFLNVSNFLPPATSYSHLLKIFNCSENKSFFPYDWFDSKEKLINTSLPPYEAFFSSLKNKNVLEENLDEKHGKENYLKLKNI